jgi:hypothetical protein
MPYNEETSYTGNGRAELNKGIQRILLENNI